MPSRLVATLRRPGSVLRKLVIALVMLVAVATAFAAGIGIYAVAPVWQPLLLAWWPGLLFGAAIIVFPGAWWLWWRLPKREIDRLRHAIRDPKARTDVEDNYRKTIGQLLGGAAVLIGAGFAYLQFQQQQTSAHDQLISNQVSRGFELLGNKDGQIEQRLGGIYALEGVMNTSQQYHQPVLEALCAFVRNETQPRLADSVAGKVLEAIRKAFGAGPTQHQPRGDLSPPTADVQAALTVIGRRTAGAGDVNLQGAHIAKAVLVEADLRSAHLSAADLRSADLTRANLHDADLEGAQLGGAVLSGAQLGGAVLSGADLSNAHLFYADLSDATLSGADLSGADLSRAILVGAPLSGAHLSGANLRSADLTRANLEDAQLGDADLSGANLHDADLRDADLEGAQGLTKEQLEQACGANVKGFDKLDPPLDPVPTIRPCPTAGLEGLSLQRAMTRRSR